MDFYEILNVLDKCRWGPNPPPPPEARYLKIDGEIVGEVWLCSPPLNMARVILRDSRLNEANARRVRDWLAGLFPKENTMDPKETMSHFLGSKGDKEFQGLVKAIDRAAASEADFVALVNSCTRDVREVLMACIVHGFDGLMSELNEDNSE